MTSEASLTRMPHKAARATAPVTARDTAPAMARATVPVVTRKREATAPGSGLS